MQESIHQITTLEEQKSQFILVHECDGNYVFADYKNRITKVEWNGIVDVNAAKEILSTGANLIENSNCDKILLSRQNLEEFTIEARLWIKHDLLMKRAKSIVNKVVKIATLNARNIKGVVFANFISTGIKFVFPHLNIRKFNMEEDALSWLQDD